MAELLIRDTKQLQRLFHLYNQRYWRGKLSDCQVVAATLEREFGHYEHRQRTIRIDPPKHKSRIELRSTMLHEMAHAASNKRGSRSHDLLFFAELERLLRRRAPLTVDNPEAGRVPSMRGLVPAKFPLLKRKMDQAEARRVRAHEREIRDRKLTETIITGENIIQEFQRRSRIALEAGVTRRWPGKLLGR